MPLWGKTDNTAGEPKFTSHHEGMDSSNFTMYGVDTTEQGVANGASGNARKFAPSHAGYVGITSYTDICLLYTSPSPRDTPISRMPSSA